jgi:uncharacterized membrane protein
MHHASFYLLKFFPVLVILTSLATTLWMARRAVTPRNQSHPVVRTASLNAAEENERGWWLGLLSTLIPLSATASLLATHWQTIPQRFPTHWDLHGQPNGWANRTLPGVFGPLLFVSVLTLGMGLLTELAARSSPGHPGRSTMIRTTRTILIAVSWVITIMFCSTSLLPLTPNSKKFVPLLTIGCFVFIFGLIGYSLYRSKGIAEAIAAGHNSTEGRFWKAGCFYYNPDDSALMVPKRTGLGYTLNFGRPASWLIFAAFLLIPLLFVLFLRHSHRH